MQNYYKHRTMYKFDAYIVSKPYFIQDSYPSGTHTDNFHSDCTYASKGRHGFHYGVNKRKFNASSHGICVDGSHVGKTDLS